LFTLLFAREQRGLGDRHCNVTELPKIDVDVGPVPLQAHNLYITTKGAGVDSAQRETVGKACHDGPILPCTALSNLLGSPARSRKLEHIGEREAERKDERPG
jgi:hypothetical protein